MISHALLLLFSAAVVLGHGRVTNPPSRASAWRYDFPTPANYDDDGLNCGGFATQWSSNGGKCGICGDAYNIPTPRPHELGGTYGLGIIVAKYLPGATIATTTHLTASHMGYWEFKLCPDPTDNSQECFDRHPLTLENGDIKYTPNRGSGIYNVNYKLPSGLICDHCVLQWRYVAGNNWGICSNGTSGLGCGNQEEFRACSDVAIGMSKTLSDESLANDIPSPLFFYLQNGYFELDQGYLIRQDPKRPTRPQRPSKPINSKRQPKVTKQQTNTPQKQSYPFKQQPNSIQQQSNPFLRQPTSNQPNNNLHQQQQQPNPSQRQPTPSNQQLNYLQQQFNPFQQQSTLSKPNNVQQQPNLSKRQPVTSKQQPNNFQQQFTPPKQTNPFQQQSNSLRQPTPKQHPSYIQQQPTFSKQSNSSQRRPNHSKHPNTSQRQKQLNYSQGQNKPSKKQNSGLQTKPSKQQLKSSLQQPKRQPTSAQHNASGKQRKKQKSRNKKKKVHHRNQKKNQNTRSQRYNYL